MQSEDIQDLLKNDFEALSARLETDRFTQRLSYRLEKKRRARIGVIAFAGGLGAAFAATQFAGVVNNIAPHIADTAPDVLSAGAAPHILATLVLACAIAVTALVVRQEA